MEAGALSDAYEGERVVLPMIRPRDRRVILTMPTYMPAGAIIQGFT